MPELTDQQIMQEIVDQVFEQSSDRTAAVDPAAEAAPAPAPAPPPVAVVQNPGDPGPNRMSIEAMKEKVQRKCPKCGKFTELLTLANNERLPGVYCTKECGWCSPLPGEVETYYDESRALGPSIVELVKMAPNNCQVRALVLSTMLVPIPNSCKTAADIFRWARTVKFGSMKEDGLLSPPVPRLNRNGGIDMPVGYSYEEYGSATYRVIRSGLGDYIVGNDDLRDMIRDTIEAEESFSELLRKVKSHLESACLEDPPECDPGRYEYEAREVGGEEDAEFEMNQDQLRRKVIDWMRVHAPGDLQQLTGE